MQRTKTRSPLNAAKAAASFRIAAAVAAVLFSGRSAHATVIDWSDTAASADWTNGANWLAGIAPRNNLVDDIARFNRAAYLSQPNAGITSIGGIQIGDGTTATAPLTISGTSLSIGESGITMSANAGASSINSALTLGAAQSWTNQSGNLLSVSGNVNVGSLLSIAGTGNVTISSVVSGAGGITKNGAGTLVLSGANTYSGLTIVNSGSLQIGNNDNVASLGAGNYEVASGAQLVFARNITPDGLAFTTQSIRGAGDVVFKNQSTGYFTLRGNYTGTLSYTGRTIVNYDAPAAGTTWFQRALWLEKDDLLPHTTVLDLQSGKVFLRANTGSGETIAGLTGNTGTFITTDQGDFQKFTVNVPSGATYTYNGVVGIDASALPIQGLNAGNVTFIKKGLGTQILTGTNTNAGGMEVRNGTLVLSGSNNYTGPTNIMGGTLVVSGSLSGTGPVNASSGALSLDYTTSNTSKLSTGNALTLAGGNLNITPNATADTMQDIAGLMLNAAASGITINKNSGTSNATVNVHTMIRVTGATLDVSYGGTGAGTASVLTENTNSSGILGGWATFGGAGWAINATNNVNGRIQELPANAYTANMWGAALHTDVTANSTIVAGSTTLSLRFNAANASTVTLAGSGTISSGGILVTPTVANNGTVITGGTLLPGAGELFVHQRNAANSLTIASTIADNGLTPTVLVKTGAGLLVPSDTNTYTGATILSGGAIRVGKIASGFEPSSLGASFGSPENLIFNGGGRLLYPGVTAQTDRGFTVNGQGGVMDVATAGTILTFQGIVVGTGGLTKAGPGQLLLAEVNTYEGNTVIEGGVLQVGNKNASTALNAGDFTVAPGSQLVFSRNSDNVAFTTQSIDGAGDVVFSGQSTGYFTFRGNYGGRLTYSGKTIVNYDPEAGGTWFQRTLWLEKDDLLPHGSVVELQSGKIYLRANTNFGETIAGLTGDATTRIATDQQALQKLTFDVASGRTYTFDGEIGFDPALATSTASISLTKTGPGTQVLGGPNTFNGGLSIQQGTIRIGASTSSATAVGSGPLTFGSANSNGTLDLNGQTAIVNGLSVAAGANPNGQVIGNSSLVGDATLVSTGTSTFGGIIVDGIAGGTRKTGLNVTGGVLTLTNAHTYSGGTNIAGGKVVLRSGSSLGNTTITVANGSTLAATPGNGAASVSGTVSLENGSVFDMVDGALGTFNVTGLGTSFLIGSEAGTAARFNFELGSTGTDRITISNAVAVLGSNTIGISVLGTSLTPASTYTLISAASGLTGTFRFSNGTQETSVLVGTTTYRLTLQNTATSTTLSVLSGALGTWAGAGSTTNTTVWATGSNWSGGVVPGAIGSTTNTDTVVFNSNPANRTPVVDSGRNVQNIIFDSAGLGVANLSGSALTLTGGGITQATASVVSSPTISAPLVLQGDYQFLNGATSSAALNVTGGVNSAVAGTLTLGGSNTADNTIGGQISEALPSLGITKIEAGKWVLSNPANSFTGPVRVLGGTLAIPSIGASLSASALGASSAGPENLILNAGTLQYTGETALTDRGLTVNGAGGTVDVTRSDAGLTFSGPVVGDGSFTKKGNGTLVFGAINTYTGNTSVLGGTLQLGDNNPSTVITNGNLSVAAGATLVLSRNVDNVAFVNQSISGDGDVKFVGQSRGYFTWRGNYIGTLSYTGKTIVNYDADTGGTWFERGFWLEKDDLLPHTTVLDVQSAKVFLRGNTNVGEVISGLMGNVDTFVTTDQAAIQKLTINVPSGKDYTYAGVIGVDVSSRPIEGTNAGNISLTIGGQGKQILSGVNTYTGPTIVNGGTLVVSGSIAGASAQVNGGGTLASGATGTVHTISGGSIVLANGGTLAPGDIGTAGTLSLDIAAGGKLSFATGSTLRFDLGVSSDLVAFSSADDWLAGSGNATLSLSGNINYNLSYTIFQNATTPNFTLAGITGYDTANYTAQFAQSGADYRLSFVVVPEPVSASSLLMGSILLGLSRLRRKNGRIPSSGCEAKDVSVLSV